MKRPAGSRLGKDPVRRRAIDAAIRHAEKIVRATGVTGPVLFHPDATKPRPADPQASKPKPSRPSRTATSSTPLGNERPHNPALEAEIRRVFGLPDPAGERQPNAAIQRGEGKPRSAPAPTSRTSPSFSGSTSPQPYKVAIVPSASATRPKQKKPGKPAKAKKRSAPKPGARSEVKRTRTAKKPKSEVVVARRTSEPAIDRKKGAASNAASRLAFNTRMRSAHDGAATVPVSPFVELQRQWQQAFAYLQRFEETNPDAPDVLAAKQRLSDVEAEWERRQALPQDHPDHFPWPSTDAPAGTGGSVAGEWQEIGMLGYLGYHVGTTSLLTAAQCTRLLEHVFLMRLPPLNGLAYMRQWGSPDTGPRLRKIAEALAAFARNAKRRRNPNLAEAIRQWEDDLSHLRRTFYVGRFDFPWPAL